MLRIFSMALLCISTTFLGMELEQTKPINPPAIFYHPGYNLGCRLLTRVHPFPIFKYAAAQAYLKDKFGWTDSDFRKPECASDELLQNIHSKEYLASLKNPLAILGCAAGGSSKLLIKDSIFNTCISFLARIILPHWLVSYLVLNPMKRATAGTVLATQEALKPDNPYKMAINLSGGYHHARGKTAAQERGDGFCFYADIQLAIMQAWKKNPELKVLYVDLDAHQGDGVELTLLNEDNKKRFFVLDMYGENNYPPYDDSIEIRNSIPYNGALTVGSYKNVHSIYMKTLRNLLPQALANIQPDLIFYNAGTDPFEGDALGRMNLTKDDMLKRDEFVFKQANQNKIPIVMTTSGGYSPESAQIIGESLENVFKKVYGVQPRPHQN